MAIGDVDLGMCAFFFLSFFPFLHWFSFVFSSWKFRYEYMQKAKTKQFYIRQKKLEKMLYFLFLLVTCQKERKCHNKKNTVVLYPQNHWSIFAYFHSKNGGDLQSPLSAVTLCCIPHFTGNLMSQVCAFWECAGKRLKSREQWASVQLTEAKCNAKLTIAASFQFSKWSEWIPAILSGSQHLPNGEMQARLCKHTVCRAALHHIFALLGVFAGVYNHCFGKLRKASRFCWSASRLMFNTLITWGLLV